MACDCIVFQIQEVSLAVPRQLAERISHIQIMYGCHDTYIQHAGINYGWVKSETKDNNAN